MKPLPFCALVVVLATAHPPPAFSAEIGWADWVHNSLSASVFEGNVRLSLSGLADLEAYSLPRTSPGLLFTNNSSLLNPRLSLFLDGQVGSKVYFFAQARLDRGFDPSDGEAEVRLDEYAIRYTPWDDGRLSLQIGKFGTVAGNWVQRHLSWDSAFVTAPLPYENLTGIWDGAAVDSPGTLLAWSHVPTAEWADFGDGYDDKHLRVPVIWGPSYATGLSAAGRLGRFEYAVEMKNSALSSRPEAWDVTEVGFEHPTFSARLGYRPNMAWRLGISASTGAYLHPEAESSLPPGRDLGDYHQRVIGQDLSFEWHHWQFFSEIFLARFEVPTVGNADTLAYYFEARYKFTPQLFGALRWNQQLFSDIEYQGQDIPWGRDLWRIDAAVGYRLTANVQLKFQSSLQRERWADSEYEHLFAGQFTVRF